NVPFAERVKRETGIATRTVGLIVTPRQAEAIIAEGKADMVALARAMLDDPHWGWHAANVLGADVARPKPYQRAAPKAWPGAGDDEGVAGGELPGLTATSAPSFRPSERSEREPESIIPSLWLWIPGSPLRGAPE